MYQELVKAHLKKLKIILNYKIILIILFLIASLRVYLNNQSKSILNPLDNSFVCNVINKTNKLVLDCGEIVESRLIDSVEIGDILTINGYLEEYDTNSNINLFNYKEYQRYNNIFYRLNINDYKKIGTSNNIVLKTKRIILNKINKMQGANYLKAFILADKSEIDTKTINRLGIVHLFCISGMHITFLVSLMENNIKNHKHKNKIINIFLISYYFLIESISILRYLIYMFIKRLDLKVNIYYQLLLSILILIIIKPSSIYNLGFYYSVIISSGIILFNKKIKINNRYLRNLLVNSFIFILSFPLSIYTSFEVNILSIIFNMIFIPFVSFFMFPLALLAFLLPILNPLFCFTIYLFELILSVSSEISLFVIFMKPSIIVIILYYLIIILLLYNYKFIYILLMMVLIHYNYNDIFKSKYMLVLNVGQGDSILLHLNNNNILIDTGGRYNYNISENITIPVLKSLGIRSISYLITSHGDYDHMGEAITLVENFKVDKVIFNCGEFNDLETDLIKVLNKKKIPYYSCIKELNIDNNKLYFLQTKEYDNENDNSNIIYTELNGYRFMFMGDASTTSEKEILNKYNLPDIDVLKIGHHGSKTSSGKEFIKEINPKYSIISVGKNNRYGHPNKEVLNNLNKSKIYRTDDNGSIMFMIKNNKLKIETCMS